MRLGDYVAQQSRTMGYVMAQKGSAADLAQEIRAIERKIRQCQQKLDRDKKRKAEGTHGPK
jgi:predicted RNA-binding protein with PIN domain